MSRIGNVLESYPSCKLQVRLPQFHGSGRRHNSPGLEMKDSLLLRAVSVARASAFCAGSLSPSSTGWHDKGQTTCRLSELDPKAEVRTWQRNLEDGTDQSVRIENTITQESSLCLVGNTRLVPLKNKNKIRRLNYFSSRNVSKNCPAPCAQVGHKVKGKRLSLFANVQQLPRKSREINPEFTTDSKRGYYGAR